jgi:hypothetical protein
LTIDCYSPVPELSQKQADFQGIQTSQCEDDNLILKFLLHDVGKIDVLELGWEEEVLLREGVNCLILAADCDFYWISKGCSLEFLDFVGHSG